jgi:glycosyltransferase involved in cell wall biosynthesis
MDKMDPNPFLSIVIPTYNRARFLDYCLEVHVPLAGLHNIQIFVSDNASTDDTKEVVDKWKCNYPLISYYSNETNIGPDDNFERALKYPNTEYVWLLGDTYRIPEGGIEYVLDIAKGKVGYDAIVFNLAEFVTSDAIEAKDYTDQNALLFDLGALMTCLSCLVYNRELIKNANFSRYKNSYFIQTGIIFESIAFRPFTIHWAQSLSIQSLQHPTLKKNGWYQTNDVFEIACKRWSSFVFSLPISYGLDVKLKCLRDRNGPSILLKIGGIVKLRMLNILNLNTYNKYSRFFPLTISYPKSIIFVISIMPRSLIRVAAVMVAVAFKRDKLKKVKRIMALCEKV